MAPKFAGSFPLSHSCSVECLGITDIGWRMKAYGFDYGIECCHGVATRSPACHDQHSRANSVCISPFTRASCSSTKTLTTL